MKFRHIATLLLSILALQSGVAQYYDWGPSPASVSWRTIKTPDLKLVYPRDFDAEARRVMWYMDTVRTHIDFGFSHGTMRTPLVLHTRNASPNGMVMWAPKRIELLAGPGASYSEPWLKQLSIHEYRHNVQYNNLRRGVMRPLMWLLGEQAAFLATGQFSIFILEGDATMAETEFSAFGRGLQPSWTMHYRAVNGGSDGDIRLRKNSRQTGAVGSGEYARDYWFSGSFRDHVPSHYNLGYQMVRWSYDRFGEFIWDDAARYVSRNPQFIVPMTIGLKKQRGLAPSELFRSAFADLGAHWNSLPRVEDSSDRIVTPTRSSYTTYRWPQWMNDTTLVAFKSDLLGTNRIVSVDVATGEERTLAHTGSVSSRPALGPDGVLWWTEFRQSMLWAEKVTSRLCSYDPATGRQKTYHDTGDQILFPVPTPAVKASASDPAPADAITAYVAYDYSGRFSIVDRGRSTALPVGTEVTGLAWDETTGALCFIGLDDGGMFLARLDRSSAKGFVRLTPSRHITISDLRAGGGKLYFGSIVSGRDEAHSYDLTTGTEHRLSRSAYGSFSPSVPSPGGQVALTTYDRHGYHLALQDAATATPQEQRTLPVDLVNPPWKRWDVPVMDSLVYTPAEAAKSTALRPSRRFSKIFNVLRPHSWLPVDFYPPAAISESDLTMNLGATVMSQSLLSDAVMWLSYGWQSGGRFDSSSTPDGVGSSGGISGSMLRGGVSYRGLGPVLDVDFSWGGAPQTLYTQIPRGLSFENKKQLSVTTRLSLPMTLSSGYWYGALTPSVEYNYTNGVIFEYTGQTSGLLTRGIERLSLGLGYSGQTRTALSEFSPRWAFSARAGYVANPSNANFRDLWTLSLGARVPGIVRPHSTGVRLAVQQSAGSDSAPFAFRMKDVFPRGARYDFSTKNWRSASVDYQLPVWYPEGGIPGLLYFKRIRLDLFADYALWQGFGGSGSGGTSRAGVSDWGGGNGVNNGDDNDTPPISVGMGNPWNRLWSYGGEVIFDLSPLRLPATNHFSAVITIARPSDSRGVFCGFGIEMPL
ncbi:MAG: hypothetical protein LBU97_04325 [Alistipes sp.]|jgi:hypothetical protein|nr:hypothetical protein [Alistipes sp.]